MSKQVDWELVEQDYRTGMKTLRQIGEENDISHGAINKRAKRDGWERDLSQKINAKAESLVSKQMVSKKVSKQTRITEKAIVDANAQSVADRVLMQRGDISRARGVVTSLFEELEHQLGDSVSDLARLGELLDTPDDDGKSSKLAEIYNKVISLPGRTDTAKKLSESLRILIELERKVLRIKDDPEPTATVVLKADPNLSPAEAYLRMLGKK